VTSAVEAFFLTPAAGAGSRFCIHHAPLATPARGLVLYVHPFAEEMNKARRMAALQARAFARAGFAVLQLDLLGCGDSSGDFGDATWDGWVDDIVTAARWLAERYRANAPPLWLWGLRAGCLLATAARPRIAAPCNLLFWQPPLSGGPLLRQFLRLKTLGDTAGGAARSNTDALRSELAAGKSIEIAGYRLSPALASGMDEARLDPPAAGCGGLWWLELSHRTDAVLSQASLEAVAAWRRAGCDVQAEVVAGPAFWQTVEIEQAPLLIERTINALCDGFASTRRQPRHDVAPASA